MKEKLKIISKEEYTKMVNRFSNGSQPHCPNCDEPLYFHHAGMLKQSSFKCIKCDTEVRGA